MAKTCAVACLSMLAIAASGAGWAQEPPTLRFAFPSAPQSMLWRAWYGPWVDRVLADAEGSIKIQPYFGSTLATMLNSYDRAVSGVADIATGVSNSMTGKLRGSTVVELPSDIPSRVASGAMWRLYERGLISAEWSEVRPLMFFIYPASTPHFVQPVERLEQLKGMKIATVSKADSDAYRLLGAAPITAAVNQLYEMLNRQVASGLVIGWAALQTFKLHEVTSYHLKMEMACGAGFFIMNKDAYAKLPEPAKRAIDRNSGFAASQGIGAEIDRSFAATEEFLKALPGHTVAALEPAEKRRWQAAIQPVIDTWVKETPNGAGILSTYRTEVAKIRDAR